MHAEARIIRLLHEFVDNRLLIGETPQKAVLQIVVGTNVAKELVDGTLCNLRYGKKWGRRDKINHPIRISFGFYGQTIPLNEYPSLDPDDIHLFLDPSLIRPIYNSTRPPYCPNCGNKI